jgi:uncharacterized protein YegP (UPF0339 family)
MVDAKFQIYKDKAEKYRFRLRAPNNKIVTVGEAYESKAGCLKGVKAVKKYCGSEIENLTKAEEKKPVPKFQLYKDRNEKYRFHLMAPNYEIVAVSEAYESPAGCLNGVKAVMNYCDAEIEDITIEKMTEPPHLHEEIVLVLDEPPVSVTAGSKVSFTGRLVEGKRGVSGEIIELYESDRSFMTDDFLATGSTKNDGSFSIDWLAKKMDWWDDSVEVYAKYKEKGSRRLIPIHSETYVIKVS